VQAFWVCRHRLRRLRQLCCLRSGSWLWRTVTLTRRLRFRYRPSARFKCSQHHCRVRLSSRHRSACSRLSSLRIGHHHRRRQPSTSLWMQMILQTGAPTTILGLHLNDSDISSDGLLKQASCSSVILIWAWRTSSSNGARLRGLESVDMRNRTERISLSFSSKSLHASFLCVLLIITSFF